MRKTKCRLAVAALGAVAAAVCGGVAPASAGAPPPGTTAVEIYDNSSDPNNSNTVVVGRVTAQPQKCAKNRRVQILTGGGGSFETTDRGRTTDRGYFALGVPFIGFETRVVALRQKIKVGGGTVICKKASDAFGIN